MKYFAPSYLGLFAYLAPDDAPGATQAAVTAVEIDPPNARLASGARQLFDAVVRGARGPSQNVIWEASAGVIDRAGLFTAPAAAAVEQTVTITARSEYDREKIGTATVTVLAKQAIRNASTVNVTVEANDQQGNPMAHAVVVAKLNRDDMDPNTGYVAPEEIIVDADENGIAILKLWPNVRGNRGSKYKFQIINPDTGVPLRLMATIPDEDCILHKIAD